MSAPCSIGRCRAGVAKVLSTTVKTSALRASDATSAIDDTKIRIRWRLKIKEPRFLADGVGYGLRTREVGDCHFDAETRQSLGEERKAVAVKHPVNNNVIARRQHCPHQGRNCAHSGADGKGRLRAFKIGYALLEDSLRRIFGAAVGIALANSGKHFGAVFGGFERVRRCQMYGRRQRALSVGRVVPDVNGACGKA
jgi:hypothetical protein